MHVSTAIAGCRAGVIDTSGLGEAMQNAKDSFYIALRNRLAQINPQRIVMLRATQRPGLLMEEAEAVVPETPNDVFVIRWTDASLDTTLDSVLEKQTCEISYATSGSSGASGLDRGRALAEMDRELQSMTSPLYTQKYRYAVTPAVAMQTQVFWSTPRLGAVMSLRDRLTRIATVDLFSFQEPGEQ